MTTEEFHAAIEKVRLLTDGRRLGIGYRNRNGAPMMRWEDGTQGPVDPEKIEQDETTRIPSYGAQLFMLGYDSEINHDARPDLIRDTRRAGNRQAKRNTKRRRGAADTTRARRR